MKKILRVIGTLLCIVMLVACNNNVINNGNEPTENLHTDIDTVTFNVEIIEIYEEVEDALWDDTVLVRSIDNQIIGDFTFRHSSLPDIGVTVGDIVTITVHSNWPEPDPAPRNKKNRK